MDAVPRAVRRLTFNGEPGVMILAGSSILSHPVQLNVRSMSDLVGTFFVADAINLSSMGGASMLLTTVDDVMTDELAGVKLSSDAHSLHSLWFSPRQPTQVVVAFGDSNTDDVRNVPTENRARGVTIQ